MAKNKKPPKRTSDYKEGGPVTATKAKKILRDGTVKGKPLTPAQKRFFGFIAGGGTPNKLQVGGQVEFREAKAGSFLGETTFPRSPENANIVAPQPQLIETVEGQPVTTPGALTGKRKRANLTGAGTAAGAFITTQQAKAQREREEALQKEIEGVSITGGGEIGLLAELESKEKIRQEGFGKVFKPGEFVGAQTGASAIKGATIGAQAGGPFGAIIGGIAGGLKGLGTGLIGAERTKRSERQRGIESEKELLDLRQKIAEGRQDVEGFGFQKGGVIEGKGTAKSDSISAKLPVGSFVVPAENSGLAAKIRRDVLDKKNTKAKLRGDGTPVKVSDGEHVFTPKEVRKIGKAGINLDLLAPNADNTLNFGDGGIHEGDISKMTSEELANEIKELELDITRQKAKDPKISLTAEGTRLAQMKTQLNFNRITRLEESNTRLVDQTIKTVEGRIDKSTDTDEIERLKTVLSDLKEKKSDIASDVTIEKGIFAGPRGATSAEVQRQMDIAGGLGKTASELGFKTKEFRPSEKDFKDRTDEEIEKDVKAAVEATKKIGTVVVDEKKVPAKEIIKELATEEELAAREREFEDFQRGQRAIERAREAKGLEFKEPTITKEEALADIEEARKKRKPPPGKTPEGLPIAEILGGAQITAATAGLIEQGKRPVGKESIELERLARQAEALESKLEFPIAEELRDIQEGERALKEFAVETGEGAVGGVFGKAVVASAQAEKQRASLRERKAFAEGRTADEFAFRKLGLTAGLRGGVERAKRQLFEDKLTAFKENQGAFANLLQSGISNIVGAQQSKEAARRERERRSEEAEKTRTLFAGLASTFGGTS